MIKKYAVIIEKGEHNYSLYVPDLPGCVSVGDTVEEGREMIREAIVGHLACMQEYGEPVPEPTTLCDYVEVDVAPVDVGSAPS